MMRRLATRPTPTQRSGGQVRRPKRDPKLAARLIATLNTWLSEKTGRSNFVCPVCGHDDFGAGEPVFLRTLRDTPHVLHDGDPIDGWAAIPTVCNTCGLAMLFDLAQCAPALVDEYL